MVQVTGNGELEGFGTAEPAGEEDYFAESITSYEGCAMTAVRWKNSDKEEPVCLRFYAEGCEEAKIKIGGKKSEKN